MTQYQNSTLFFDCSKNCVYDNIIYFFIYLDPKKDKLFSAGILNRYGDEYDVHFNFDYFADMVTCNATCKNLNNEHENIFNMIDYCKRVGLNPAKSVEKKMCSIIGKSLAPIFNN